MAPQAKEKTAFVLDAVVDESTHMPGGLKAAPAPYQRLMNKLPEELNNEGKVLVYLDDVLVFSLNVAEHLQTLDRFCDILNSTISC